MRFFRPATRAFLEEGRRVGMSRFDRLHGYVYGRWPYLYIGVGTGEHPLSRVVGPVVGWLGRWLPKGDGDKPQFSFADTYHGKVMPLEAAAQLVTVNEDVTLANLEPIIPYALARDIVLRNPDHIVVLECPCRAAREKPCLPLDVCLIVGEPFASFVREQHPHRSRWISQQEAVDVLRAEQERGHVSHAFFKDAMLGRFYAICNCCSCCCAAMRAHRNGTPMLASSGYVAQVDAGLCAACGTCAGSCQFAAISTDDGLARIDASACMGCGVCVSKCRQEALSLARDPSRGEPLILRELMGESLRGMRNADDADW
jgi:ferredoxin